MHPSISVVVPCFNAATTIVRCLDSVLSQTLLPSEIIIIDDGSQDGSLEIVKRLENRNSTSCKIIALTQTNSGPSATRNRGIALATGDYIALIDSDDFWLSNHLEVAYRVSRELNPTSFAIVHQPLVEDELPKYIPTNGVTKYCRFSVLRYLFVQKNCSTITLFGPSSLVKRYEFPSNQRYAEDFRFFIRLFQSAADRVYVKTPRTAVMGKHAWASDKGLSSKRWSMLAGVLSSLVEELVFTRYFVFLVVLLPWHFMKALRREILFLKLRQTATHIA